MRETSITLTPVGEGRFEVFLNGTKLYDRKEGGEQDFLPSLQALRALKSALQRELEETPARA